MIIWLIFFLFLQTKPSYAWSQLGISATLDSVSAVSELKVINLKVPKCEIFGRSDFHDFYTIKSLWEGDFGVKIKCLLKNI